MTGCYSVTSASTGSAVGCSGLSWCSGVSSQRLDKRTSADLVHLHPGYGPRIVTARERYPELFQFLGAYLHQDFPEVHGDADAALAASMRNASPERLIAVHAQLTDLLETVDEAAAERAVNELCDYYPPGDGWTYIGWLEEVDRRVRERS